MSPTLQEVLRPYRRALTILWLALVAAVPTYVVIGFVSQHFTPDHDAPLTLGTAAALSAIAAIGSILVPRFYPSGAMISQALSLDTDPESLARAPEGGAVDRAQAEKIRELDREERKVLQLRPLFQQQMVVRSALAEAVAISGFILVLEGHEAATLLPFATASLLLLIVAFPRFDRFVERATQLPPA